MQLKLWRAHTKDLPLNLSMYYYIHINILRLWASFKLNVQCDADAFINGYSIRRMMEWSFGLNIYLLLMRAIYLYRNEE